MNLSFFSKSGGKICPDMEISPQEPPFAVTVEIPARHLKKACGLLSVKYSFPIRDVAGYFNPTLTEGPVHKLDWNIGFEGHATRNSPVCSLISQSNENKLTVSFDNFEDDFTFDAGMNQETSCYDATWTFSLSGKVRPLRICFDCIPGKWQHAYSRVKDRFMEGRDISFPPGAFDPVYCTWYAVHAELTGEYLDENARLARELGCGTFIVDDGWCYDEMKRVSPETLPTWYDDIGDWILSKKKLPDFRENVRYAQSLGLKYLIWVAPYFCFRNSNLYKSLPEHLRSSCDWINTPLILHILKDRKLSSKVISKLAGLVKKYGLDGLKVDFLDCIHADVNSPRGPYSLDFVKKLSSGIRKNCPGEALIEFRQRYSTLQMLPYATQFRAGDAPFDYLVNLSRIAAMRILLGDGVPIHADPVYWNPDENDLTVARHMIASLAGVPMISMELSKLNRSHKAIVKHYLDFYKERQELFSHGKWFVEYSLSSIPSYFTVSMPQKAVAIVVDQFLNTSSLKDLDGEIELLNLSSSPIPADRAFDFCGNALPDGVIPCGGHGTLLK